MNKSYSTTFCKLKNVFPLYGLWLPDNFIDAQFYPKGVEGIQKKHNTMQNIKVKRKATTNKQQ